MCGLASVIGSQQASLDIFLALNQLQHRGQDAAGICSYDPQGEPNLQVIKSLGLVNQGFTADQITHLRGPIALGHTRYATVGKKGDRRNIQPMVTNYPIPIAMCHNGNLVNYFSLKDELKSEQGFVPLTGSDLEVILRIFVAELTQQQLADSWLPSSQVITQAIQKIQQRCEGAYSVVGLIADQILFGFCDSHGIRPLVCGRRFEEQKNEWSYMLCSEDNALNFLGFEKLFDVGPGECVLIAQGQEPLRVVLNQKPLRACMFEWVYFAGADSQIRSLPVYSARLKLGVELGKQVKQYIEQHNIKIDLVTPVPDTSRTAAIALAETIARPYRETLIKNRYVQRSFIMNLSSERDRAVELKLSPIISELQGRSILLVDDSIVRGTTLRRIIRLVKKAGVTHVYVATTCPPIRFGCFYGIDFPDPKKLVANSRTHQEIEKELGADAIFYLDIEALKASLLGENLCLGCLTGQYPTQMKQANEFSNQRNLQKEMS